MHKDIHVQSRAVIIRDDHILLCKTTGLSPDFYFLPGGHIDHGESAQKALIRELREEIGLDFDIKRFLGCLEYSFDPNVIKHAKCHTHEYTFIFEAYSNSLDNIHKPLKQQEDHIRTLWLSMDDFQHIDVRPAILKTLLSKWLCEDLNSALKSVMV